jgi:hypothetical protein
MAVSITEQTYSSVKKIDFAWTAVTTGSTGGTTVKSYDGQVLRVVCNNTLMAGGTITINDEDGMDILQGAGVLSTGISYAGTSGSPPISAVAESPLTFAVISKTANGAGHCYVYIR